VGPGAETRRCNRLRQQQGSKAAPHSPPTHAPHGPCITLLLSENLSSPGNTGNDQSCQSDAKADNADHDRAIDNLYLASRCGRIELPSACRPGSSPERAATGRCTPRTEIIEAAADRSVMRGAFYKHLITPSRLSAVEDRCFREPVELLDQTRDATGELARFVAAFFGVLSGLSGAGGDTHEANPPASGVGLCTDGRTRRQFSRSRSRRAVHSAAGRTRRRFR
jgi:hypothetical protein